jgi:hypothetical protein
MVLKAYPKFQSLEPPALCRRASREEPGPRGARSEQPRQRQRRLKRRCSSLGIKRPPVKAAPVKGRIRPRRRASVYKQRSCHRRQRALPRRRPIGKRRASSSGPGSPAGSTSKEGQVEHAAFKGRFLGVPAQELKRPWTQEASGRLSSIAGTQDEIKSHAEQYCRKLGTRYAGIMFCPTANARGSFLDISTAVNYTPIRTGRYPDEAQRI